MHSWGLKEPAGSDFAERCAAASGLLTRERRYVYNSDHHASVSCTNSSTSGSSFRPLEWHRVCENDCVIAAHWHQQASCTSPLQYTSVLPEPPTVLPTSAMLTRVTLHFSSGVSDVVWGGGRPYRILNCMPMSLAACLREREGSGPHSLDSPPSGTSLLCTGV